MAAIHQHGQLDRVRAAIVHESVERCADRPTRVEHVVDQHDVGARDI